MPKPVAVILLNWNTPQYSFNCIKSLLAHCDQRNFDVIITDNGSTDNSFVFLKKEFPEAYFIDNKKNLGFAEGNNRALAYSIQKGYRYSLLLNSDTDVKEDIVSPLLTYLENNKSVGGCQPAIYWMHEPSKIWNGASYFNSFLGITYSKKTQNKKKEIKKVDWITGCAMMLRNEALCKSGLFTERFFLYYEDVDLSFRIRKAGYELHYLPNLSVYHEAGASGKQKAKNKEGVLQPIIHYYINRNKIWILRKYGSPWLAPLNILIYSFYYIPLFAYFALRRRWQKASFLLKGIKEGLFAPLSSIWTDKINNNN